MKKIIFVASFLMMFSYTNAQEIVRNVIIFKSLEEIGQVSGNNDVTAKMISELLVNDIRYSSKTPVVNEGDFDAYFEGQNKKAELYATGNVDYSKKLITVNVLKNNQNIEHQIHYENGSALLNGAIAELSQNILDDLTGADSRGKYHFTNNWDAYLQYVEAQKFAKESDAQSQLDALNRAIEIDPTFHVAKLEAAGLYSRFGIYEQRRKYIDEVLEHTGQLSEMHVWEAEAADANAAGNYPLYRDVKLKIQKRRPYELATYFETGSAFYGLSEMENAIQYYKIVLKMQPDNARAHNNIGYAYSHMGLHDQAISHYQKSIDINPAASTYDSLADGYSTAGFIDKAKDAKKKGIELDPSLFYLYGYLAYLDIRQGMFKEAKKNTQLYLDRVNDLNNQTEGMFREAYIHYMKKEYKQALEMTKNAIEVFDSYDIVARNHKIHWLKALAHIRLGQNGEARKELKDMENLVDQYKISAVNYRTNLYKGMLHIVAEFALQKGDIQAIDNIVYIFNDPKGIRYKVHGHGSNFEITYFNTMFGEMYFKAGEYKKAEEILLKGLDHNPSFAMARYTLWKLYEKTGQTQKAEEQKEKFKYLWRYADEDAKDIYEIS